MSKIHECNFVEEQEPEGRLILGPCLECGIPAADAIKHLKAALDAEREGKHLWESVAVLASQQRDEYKHMLKVALEAGRERGEEVASLKANLDSRKDYHEKVQEQSTELASLRAKVAKLETEKSWRDYPDRSGGAIDPNERHEMGG